jgi:CBS domain-containing protein
VAVAIGAEATFIARTIDSNVKHMAEILLRAAAHKGTSFVEIYQNCVIFNDGAWEHVTDKAVKDDNMLPLEHGKPLIFGKNSDRGIILDGLDPKVVMLGNGVSEDDLLVHDEARMSPSLAYMLSQMDYPDFPAPVGVFRSVDKPVYTEGVIQQVQAAIAKKGEGTLESLYFDADTWTVTESEAAANEATGAVTFDMDEEYMDGIDEQHDDLGDVQHSLLTDPVADLIAFEPISVGEASSLDEAISIMREKKIGSLLVTDEDGTLTGIFTETDVMRRVACLIQDLKSAQIGDFMTPNPSTIKGDQPIAAALHLMSVHLFRHVPIVDEDHRPIGIISFRDVGHFIDRYF